jgi:hypothetical protein
MPASPWRMIKVETKFVFLKNFAKIRLFFLENCLQRCMKFPKNFEKEKQMLLLPKKKLSRIQFKTVGYDNFCKSVFEKIFVMCPKFRENVTRVFSF